LKKKLLLCTVLPSFPVSHSLKNLVRNTSLLVQTKRLNFPTPHIRNSTSPLLRLRNILKKGFFAKGGFKFFKFQSHDQFQFVHIQNQKSFKLKFKFFFYITDHEEVEELLYAFAAPPPPRRAAVSVPASGGLTPLALPPLRRHADLVGGHADSPLLPLHHRRLVFRLRRVQALPATGLRAPAAAAPGLPGVGLSRRRRCGEAGAAGAVPPRQPLRGAPRPGGLGGGARGSGEVCGGAPAVPAVRECEGDQEDEPGDLPGPHHGGQHPPRRLDSQNRRGFSLHHVVFRTKPTWCNSLK